MDNGTRFYTCMRARVGEQVDPNQLYELQAKLDDYGVYYRNEVDEFARIFYKPKKTQTLTGLAKIHACLDPAVKRFNELEDRQEEFRKTLTAYKNLYAFLSQIIPFHDTDLEKLYSYLRFLLTKLPKRSGPKYCFDDEVTLQYYRLQKISEGELSLEPGEKAPIAGPLAVRAQLD